MSDPKRNDEMGQSESGSIWQSERVRRLIRSVLALLIAFLLGLIPMWMIARGRARERDAAQATLRISALQNYLASAAIDARQGRYEPARLAASDFFTGLEAEMARGQDSVFTEAQRNSLRSMFATRDDTITLLARSDPASSDRLAELYNAYRQANAQSEPQR
ncbi:MAG TPA: hypothetical protein VJT09_08515 [Pyrinomonadaceae bacterium]|nr:hypothetical protein [Pyrinomonadaceae bacterium]